MSERTLILPGQRLREAREGAGKTLAEVSASLHLSVSYIKALEADDYDRLPEPTFVRGYIRNYARLLSLPGDELANLFQQLVDEAKPRDRERERDTGGSQAAQIDPRYWWAGAAMLVVLLLWLIWPSEPASESASSSAIESSVVEQNTASVEQGSVIEPGVAGSDLLGDEMTTVIESEQAEPAQVEEPEPLTDALLIRFSDVCWLRVRDVNGDEIYVGQRAAGDTLALNGQSPFRITLGNAAAVSAIEINQIAVAVPVAAPGQVVTVRAP